MCPAPQAKPEPGADANAEDKAEDKALPRILVADDSKVIRLAAVKILKGKFEVVVAKDGVEALDILAKDHSIQVVLTDLGMPNLDGYQFIEKLRQSPIDELRNLPVIVITAAAEEEEVKKKVFDIGATDFVTKPFNSIEITARIEAHASYQRTKASLQEKVDVDVLTGTLNKKGLNEKLEKDISFVNRHQQNMALVVFELDNFQELFKKAGQRGADKIIQNVSKVLGSAIRREDSFGRYDVAKFLTILPMAKTEGVVMLAKRLCEHIKTYNISLGAEKINLSMSVGIAAVPKGAACSAKDLLKTANKALANAKSLGPGEVQLLKLEGNQPEKAPASVSIDNLLDILSENGRELTPKEITAAASRLLPLVKLMPRELKSKLFKNA